MTMGTKDIGTVARRVCRAAVAGTLLAQVAAAQSPTDSVPRPRPGADSTRAPQPIAPVRVEAAPDAKVSTPAERRLRMGGHLYTKAEIERVGARGWMDAARLTGGVSVIMYPVRPGSTLMGRRLSMMGSGGRCTPAVFVDALRQNIIEFDWDDFLAVTAIESMEVYSSTSAPLEFRSLTGTCGSVVIWTRPER